MSHHRTHLCLLILSFSDPPEWFCFVSFLQEAWFLSILSTVSVYPVDMSWFETDMLNCLVFLKHVFLCISPVASSHLCLVKAVAKSLYA